MELLRVMFYQVSYSDIYFNAWHLNDENCHFNNNGHFRDIYLFIDNSTNLLKVLFFYKMMTKCNFVLF